MSHTQFVYPQTTPAAGTHHLWQIREDEGDYPADFTALIDLTDIIDDKLLKAEALAWVLHGAREYPDNAIAETTAVIAEFIREAIDAHDQQWEKIRRFAKRKR
jgi:hypothetical protein